MRDNKLHTPAGVRDLLFEECAEKRRLEQKTAEIFRRYGYRQVESPMFEYIEVFAEERQGNTSPSQMYQFFDRDGSTLALRSDMTPPIARIAATAYANDEGPLRFCYFGNTFRFNGSYEGKPREVSQAGIELMGVSSAEADAEVIAVAIHSMLAAGLSAFKVTIGQVPFFKAVLQEAGLCEEESKRLQDYIAGRDYVAAEQLVKKSGMPEESRRLFLELPKLVGTGKMLRYAAGLTKKAEAIQALKELGKLYTLLVHYGVEQYVTFDLGMVNKLHYYTGIIFRGYTEGTGYAVLSGGRYDGLVKQYGRKLPAVGFGIKIAGMLSALQFQKKRLPEKKAKTLVAYTKEGLTTAFRTADRYRDKGWYMETSLLGENLEENLAYAKSRGMSHVLYFTDEVHLKVISLTDKMGGYTAEIRVDELIEPVLGEEE